jgi:hypothetical protein
MIVDDHLDTSVKIIRCNERACALHEDHDLRLFVDHDELVESVK